MSVHEGVMSEILAKSPLVARILPPVEVEPMLTMRILEKKTRSVCLLWLEVWNCKVGQRTL